MNKSKITRREFIGGAVAAGALTKTGLGAQQTRPKIDRFALVSRHNPILRKFEPLSPLSVGNGEFAFTCDATGLQTFPDEYKDAMPLCTMSQWGWHTTPKPDHLKSKELKLTEYNTYGRKVGYMTTKTSQEELFDYLRETPKNHYVANGHNYQRPNLPLYLPGNGGLLYAVALMANGRSGGPKTHAPGFPSDGSWTVRAEGFNAALFREI